MRMGLSNIYIFILTPFVIKDLTYGRVILEDANSERSTRLLDENIDKNSFASLLSRVEKLERCVNVRPIGFTAVIFAPPTSISNHQIIVFDHVITNIGNALQPASSIFTAPVNGTYFFEVTIGPSTAGTTDVELLKNGSHLRRIYSHSDNGEPETSTESVVVHLNTGDQVWVRHLKYNSGIAGWEHPSFSGFLIKADC